MMFLKIRSFHWGWHRSQMEPRCIVGAHRLQSHLLSQLAFWRNGAGHMGTADTQQESYTKYIFLNDPPKPSRNLAHQDSDQTLGHCRISLTVSSHLDSTEPLGSFNFTGVSLATGPSYKCGFLVPSPWCEHPLPSSWWRTSSWCHLDHPSLRWKPVVCVQDIWGRFALSAWWKNTKIKMVILDILIQFFFL